MRKLLYSVAIQLGVIILFMLTSCFSSTPSPPQMFDWDDFVSRMERERRMEAGNPPRKHKKPQTINPDQKDLENPEMCTAPQNLRRMRTRSIGKDLTCVAEQSAYPSVGSSNVLGRRVFVSEPLREWVIKAPHLSFITLIRPHSFTSAFLREPRMFDRLIIDKKSSTYIDVLLLAGTYPKMQNQYCVLSTRIFEGDMPTLRFVKLQHLALSVELSKDSLDQNYLHLNIMFTISDEFTLSKDQTHEDILISSDTTILMP